MILLHYEYHHLILIVFAYSLNDEQQLEKETFQNETEAYRTSRKSKAHRASRIWHKFGRKLQTNC